MILSQKRWARPRDHVAEQKEYGQQSIIISKQASAGVIGASRPDEILIWRDCARMNICLPIAEASAAALYRYPALSSG
jgi:hypothetical protein